MVWGGTFFCWGLRGAGIGDTEGSPWGASELKAPCEKLSTFSLALQVPSVCLLEKENLLFVPQMENQHHDHKEKEASKCLQLQAGQRGPGVSLRPELLPFTAGVTL